MPTFPMGSRVTDFQTTKSEASLPYFTDSGIFFYAVLISNYHHAGSPAGFPMSYYGRFMKDRNRCYPHITPENTSFRGTSALPLKRLKNVPVDSDVATLSALVNTKPPHREKTLGGAAVHEGHFIAVLEWRYRARGS